MKRCAIVFLLFAASMMGLTQPYGEAPMLASRVEAGELPPVAERLPDEPYVVTPYEEIGRYGGTARVVCVGTNCGDVLLMQSGFNGWVMMNPNTGEIEPHLMRQVEVNDDFTSYTFYLREGLRWSDGVPFTTEDIAFWYNDVIRNSELTPSPPGALRLGGELAVLDLIDEYTFSLTFAGPKPFFLNQAHHSSAYWTTPKHYLSQFHIAYTDPVEVQAMATAAGFDNWFQLFGDKNRTSQNIPVNPDLPTMGSYVMLELTTELRRYERNPYYWKVDTEGNQLPYIDEIYAEVVADRELYQGRIITGEVTLAGLQTSISNFPLYRRFEDEGDYRVALFTSGMGADVVYQVNMTHSDETLREIFGDVRFRQALSLAINREEISQEVYFGRAEPRQYTLLEISRYYKPEYATAFTEFDLERARALLDEMGLQTDAQGRRLRPDNNQPISFTIEYFDIETPKTPTTELVAEYWGELGLNVSFRSISGELARERTVANLMDATLWHGDKATDVLFPVAANFFVPAPFYWEIIWSSGWVPWFESGGQEGLEPPDNIKELRSWWDEILVADDQARIDELADKILQAQAENLWVIGTVGNAPHPVIVDNDLGNLPPDALWVWDTLWLSSHHPEQLFFRNR
jgi:peptide/nickel transport system substrate-binding protein